MEYQGFLKIKKEKTKRTVFWKHLMCQLIKCVIANKLPRPRSGKQPGPSATLWESQSDRQCLTPKHRQQIKSQADGNMSNCAVLPETTNGGSGPRSGRKHLQITQPRKGTHSDLPRNPATETTQPCWNTGHGLGPAAPEDGAATADKPAERCCTSRVAREAQIEQG